MQTLPPYSIFHLGDTALTIDFGNRIDDAVNKKLLRLFYQLKESNIPCIKDLVPAYSSLTVYYDVVELKKKHPDQTAFDTMSDMINAVASEFSSTEASSENTIEIPVCYSKKFALDLDVFEKEKGISHEELIRLHTSRVYRVYMLGFLPGFAYMAEVDAQLEIPRKEIPRTHVPAGAVGIAGKQTGIYPFDSPGGWQIIGCTPEPLFDKEREPAVWLQPGDNIKFYSISEDEFAHYQGRHS